MKLQLQLKIRIVYKSGYTHDFYVTQFSISKGTYSWTACNTFNSPVLIGADEIAAVFQVGRRYRLKF